MTDSEAKTALDMPDAADTADGQDAPSDEDARLGPAPSPMLAEVEALIEPPIMEMGYRLVRVTLSGQPAVLQVMAERADAPMTVEDCAAVSRAISTLLDVADPITDRYTLEVSSPGIDRPLTRRGDLARFAGFEARLEMTEPVMGQRKFTGRIIAVEGDELIMRFANDEEMELPIAHIKTAKLKLTDELIEASKTGFAGLN